MKRSVSLRLVWVLGCLALGMGVGGCPVDLASVEPPPAAAGLYWAEHADGELSLYRLPDERGEAGIWFVVPTDEPEWYSGPAVYALDEEGNWTRETDGDDLTLDEVIQLYDIAPPPEP